MAPTTPTDEQWQQEFDQRERHSRQQVKVTIGAVLVSLLALCGTLIFQFNELGNSNEQFRRGLQEERARFALTLSRSEYSEIVSGLASESVAVQNSSMRRLVDYTVTDSNFAVDQSRQELAFKLALNTLTAFIVDESLDDKRVGLSAFYDPQPIIVPRAMSALKELTSDPMSRNVADFSSADLHGASLRDFAPTTHIFAANVDLRRATLTGLDLTKEGVASTLRASFLTCASLVDARFGEADLASTDFTGADLSGADLSMTTGLGPDQIRGATISAETRLPPEMDSTPRAGWGVSSDQCYELANKMTGMRGGQGYTPRIPCPVNLRAMERASFEPRWRGDPQSLLTACRMRLSAPD